MLPLKLQGRTLNVSLEDPVKLALSLASRSVGWRWRRDARHELQWLSLLAEQQCLHPNIKTYNKKGLVGRVEPNAPQIQTLVFVVEGY